MGYRVAIDIGGTFADGVIEVVPDGTVHLAKRLTTHHDPGEAVSAVIDDLLAVVTTDGVDPTDAAAQVEGVVHGSTLVTNSLIERKGAPTALVTTAGTADVLDIRREVRYDLYDLNLQLPEPLVPPERRFEVDERVGADGAVLRRPSPKDLDRLVAQVQEAGVQSVAVSFLHACGNADNEKEVAETLLTALPDLHVSLSSRVAAEIREYERTTTATANAYVQPLVERYLGELDSRLRKAGIDASLRIMNSSGGSSSARAAAEVPISTIESGPAGGVLSAANAGSAAGLSDLLAFDMGGTTAKLSAVVSGTPSVVHTFEAARVHRFKKGSGLPLLVPSIDLIEIGSGGGSIARVNELGLLTVGPRSAGSEPGPACYGQGGTEATVTDADLVLGYLNPDYFLGGRMRLDLAAAERAIDTLAGAARLARVNTATGIFQIVNETMAGAARVHIAEKSQDPRTFTLVATGGAGPVHAVEIARKLQVPRVLFPIAAGAGSCLGLLAAPVRVERSWSTPTRVDQANWAQIAETLSDLRSEAEVEIGAACSAETEVDWSLLVDMCYVGQAANLTLEFPFRRPDERFGAELVDEFTRAYRRDYGGITPAETPEIVTWRVVGSTRQDIHRFVWPAGTAADGPPTPQSHRSVFRPDRDTFDQVPVYRRYLLGSGEQLRAPLILEEEESTIAVPVAARVEILDDLGVLVRLED